MSDRNRWHYPLVVVAALTSSALALAQSTHYLYIANLAKTFGEPTPAPQPTATPGPVGSCSSLLNAATLSGPFTFSFSGAEQHTFDDGFGHTEDLTASIHRTLSATVTLANRIADTDENGDILMVNWEVTAITQPTIVVNDSWTSIQSGPPIATYHSAATGGTLRWMGVEGYLEMYADCTYALTLWPWADQTVDGLAGYDNLFRFSANGVPVSGTTLTQNVQAPTYFLSQNLGTERPLYTVELGSARTEGVGNSLARQLLRAETQNSAAVNGRLTETSTITWNFSAVP